MQLIERAAGVGAHLAGQQFLHRLLLAALRRDRALLGDLASGVRHYADEVASGAKPVRAPYFLAIQGEPAWRRGCGWHWAADWGDRAEAGDKRGAPERSRTGQLATSQLAPLAQLRLPLVDPLPDRTHRRLATAQAAASNVRITTQRCRWLRAHRGSGTSARKSIALLSSCWSLGPTPRIGRTTVTIRRRRANGRPAV
jgi:hypothetical protein